MFAMDTTLVSALNFTVWKTLVLGAHKSIKELQGALEEKGVVIDSGGSVILHADEFVLSAEEKEIDIVLASLKDLGFSGKNSIDHWDVCKRAYEIGLRLCPAEVGPALCLACEKGELMNHGIVIAMPLMSDGRCNPQAFFVCYDENYSYDNEHLTGKDAVVLAGAHDGPDFRWCSATLGAFVKVRRV